MFEAALTSKELINEAFGRNYMGRLNVNDYFSYVLHYAIIWNGYLANPKQMHEL